MRSPKLLSFLFSFSFSRHPRSSSPPDPPPPFPERTSRRRQRPRLRRRLVRPDRTVALALSLRDRRDVRGDPAGLPGAERQLGRHQERQGVEAAVARGRRRPEQVVGSGRGLGGQFAKSAFGKSAERDD